MSPVSIRGPCNRAVLSASRAAPQAPRAFLGTGIRNSIMTQFFSLAWCLVRRPSNKTNPEQEKSVLMLAAWRPNNCHADPHHKAVGPRVALCAMAVGVLLASSVLAREPGFGEARAVGHTRDLLFRIIDDADGVRGLGIDDAR